MMGAIRFAVLAVAGVLSLALSATAGSKLATGNGFVWLVLESDQYGSGQGDVLFSAIALDGSSSVTRPWGGPIAEHPKAITVDPSGNAVIVGNYDKPLPWEYVATPSFVVKFDSAGNKHWATHIGWADFTVDLRDVATDDAGNIYVCGASWKWLPVAPDGGYPVNELIYLAKFGPDGTALWAKRWSSRPEDNLDANSVEVYGNEIAVTSSVLNPSTKQRDMLVLRYNSGGDLTGVEACGLGMYLKPVASAITDEGALYSCYYNIFDDVDVYIAKFRPGGGLDFIRGFGNYLKQYPSDIAVDGDNVFVVGQTTKNPDDFDHLDAFYLWFLNDVLVNQVQYFDPTGAACGFTAIIPADPTFQVYYGSGPFAPETGLLELEMLAEDWFPNGSVWTPDSYEDENCAMTMLGEPEGAEVGRVLTHEEFKALLEQRHEFLGILKFRPAVHQPTAVVTSDVSQGTAPLTVSFDASASWCDNGTIVRYEWDWSIEDGASATDASTIGPVTSHTYETPGTYTASVRVVSDDGTTSQAIWVIVVDP